MSCISALSGDCSLLLDIVECSKDWAQAHGISMRQKSRKSSDVLEHVPFTLLPTVVEKFIFEQAYEVQNDMNNLYHRVAFDYDFICSCLSGVVEIDEFTKQLLTIYHELKSCHLLEDTLALTIQRSDYMLHEQETGPIQSSLISLKQVEVNNISSSFAALSTKTTEMHKYLLKRYRRQLHLNPEQIPNNPALDLVADGLIAGWRYYRQTRASNSKNLHILFVIEEFNRNIMDQRAIEDEVLRLTDYECQITRLTLRQCDECLKLDPLTRRLFYCGPKKTGKQNEWLVEESGERLSSKRSIAALQPNDMAKKADSNGSGGFSPVSTQSTDLRSGHAELNSISSGGGSPDMMSSYHSMGSPVASGRLSNQQVSPISSGNSNLQSAAADSAATSASQPTGDSYGPDSDGTSSMDREYGHIRVQTAACSDSETSNEAQAIEQQLPEIAVVYYRVGYVPEHYPTEIEWRARALMERSLAVKCPWIGAHLAGTKKVQQVLATDRVLNKFFSSDADDQMATERIRKTFANLYGLEKDGKNTESIVKSAMENPHSFVLKPQLEGGGHNFFGEDVKLRLQKLTPFELQSFILMQKLNPKVNTNIIVGRPGAKAISLTNDPIASAAVASHTPKNLSLLKHAENGVDGSQKEGDSLASSTAFDECNFAAEKVVGELGIFGYLLSEGLGKIIANKTGGHLLRTKSIKSNEGGVMAGASALDSPYLI